MTRKRSAVRVRTAPPFSQLAHLYILQSVTNGRFYVGSTLELQRRLSQQHFLMIKSQQPSAMQLNVVLNWLEELRRRVPAGTR